MISVYEPSTKSFKGNGIKVLKPMIAEITKTDNGDYFVEVRDKDEYVEYYQKGMILYIDTPWGKQGFRCDNPIITNNRIDVKAWHISYDSKNYIIKDAYAVDKNCNDALDHMNSATDIPSPFKTISDISILSTTRTVRKSLFDVYTEFIDPSKYGGHWVRDNWTLGIRSKIGQDKQVVIAYKKNLTDIKVTEKWDDVVTKILPYTTYNQNEVLLDEVYVSLEENLYEIPFTKVVKFENKLEKAEETDEATYLTSLKEWLMMQANEYLEQHKFPEVTYEVGSNITNISDIGDIIHVKHPKIKVNIITNVISVNYDAISGRYNKITFGNFKQNFGEKMNNVITSAEKKVNESIDASISFINKELEGATDKFNESLSKGYVITESDRILVLDALPKEKARNVMRINHYGIGFSQNGINGVFNSAWSIDGTLNMQAINVINLTASLIKGGTLKLGGVNNSSGTFELYDNTNRLIALMDRAGLTVYATNGDYVKLNADVGFAGYDKNHNKVYWADGNVFHMANAEVDNEIKIAGKIKIVPVANGTSKGVGFVALS